MDESLKEALKQEIEQSSDKISVLNEIRAYLHELSCLKSQPVDYVIWVPLDKVQANDYNPNSVAKKEMGLLYTSIKSDGYTQPTVTVYDPEKDKYIIVDGFHRYFVCKTFKDIYESNQGMLPVVVIEKSLAERMAATVRHNRARGVHSIDGMSNLVFQMLEEGHSDNDVCNELGLDAEELLKLKHITGFSKLFEDAEYRKAWETEKQILIRKKYQESLKTENKTE